MARASYQNLDNIVIGRKPAFVSLYHNNPARTAVTIPLHHTLPSRVSKPLLSLKQ